MHSIIEKNPIGKVTLGKTHLRWKDGIRKVAEALGLRRRFRM